MEENQELIAQEYTGKEMELVVWPDARLLKTCESVTKFDKDLEHLILNMHATMNAFQGVGLSAPQVGVMKRVIVFTDGVNSSAMVNPKVLSNNNNTELLQEGCLSFPGVYVKVNRFTQVTVQFQDVDGNENTVSVEGYPARIIQHEIDHLDGHVFTRYLSGLKKDLVLRKMKKLVKRLKKR